MNQNELNEIKKIILKNSIYYEAPMNEVRLEMFAEDLSSLTASQVLQAFEKLRQQPNRFRLPLPAEIKAVFAPSSNEKDQAREIAMRITKSVSRFGYADGEQARAYIGEQGWLAVLKWGGWSYVCENLGTTLDVNNFIAQTRDSIESFLKAQPLLPESLQLNANQEKHHLLEPKRDVVALVDLALNKK